MNWQMKAVAWLRGKAAEQAQNNERWPEHAKCYPSWTERVEQMQRLASELESEATVEAGHQTDEVKRLRDLLRRGLRQLEAWQEKYGEWQPQWLPPAGDVRWAEDVEDALKTPNAEFGGRLIGERHANDVHHSPCRKGAAHWPPNWRRGYQLA